MDHSKAKTNKRKIVFAAVLTLILACFITWKIVRSFTSVTCTIWNVPLTTVYSEQDKVLTSISLSCFVYGCENCEALTGSVKNILSTEKMGIIIENADIKRLDPSDPASALIDSATFIKHTVGNYRFLTELKDERSSFYGAAFADDLNKVVWITYSGSVSLIDAIQSAKLILGAGLSQQEKSAFDLYEKVIETNEITSKNYNLILTGHSLGGALASMVSRMSGCEAVTINGADGIALDKIYDIVGEKPEAYQITNYLTSPQNGKISFKNIIQHMMFWGSYDAVDYHVYEDNGMVENAHCVFGFIEFENDDFTKPILPENEINW